MRRKLTMLCCGLLALAAWPVLAQETFNDNATDKVAGRAGVAGEKGEAPLGPQSRVGAGASVNVAPMNAGVRAGAATPMGGNGANRWRYRYHNNHWWYYHPSNQWSYWNGNAWSGYNPQNYRQWYANRPGYSGGYYSGYRGYNTYGNGMYGYNGYGNGMYGGYGGYGNGYGNNYGYGYGSPSANMGGAIGGAIGGARGANAGAAIGGAAGGGFGRR